MGLFDWLFGGNARPSVQILNDRIWKSQAAKFNGIRKRLQDPTDSVVILLIAHFNETLKRLEAIADDYQGDVPIQTTLAERLSTEIADRLDLEETSTVDLIVAERHPSLSEDERLVQFAQAIQCRCRVTYFLSLDDPLLKLFAGGWVGKILENLGMKDDEAIESAMVSKRLRAAQKTIQAKAVGNRRAESADEWLELNVQDV